MKKQKDGSGSSPKPPKTVKKLTSDDIISFLKNHNGRASKAQIAREFGVTGEDRIGLKHVLKEMLTRGTLHQGSFRGFVLPPVLAPGETAIPRLSEADKIRYPRRAARELERDRAIAEGRPPVTREAPRREAPAPARRDDRRPPIASSREETRERPPAEFIGLYQPMQNGGGMVNPVSRQDKNPIMIPEGRNNGARRGDLVKAIFSTAKGWSILEVLGEEDDAGLVSLMAIRTMDIPHVFPQEALDETIGITVPALGKRTDLRALPLVTIDGEDSRDFDDAVHAEPDTSPDNKHGWVITVAIADVSHYVHAGSALDREAYKRGNSVYFPDRVVPMLPEALSNDLCSLRPHEDRACMAAIMRINHEGFLIDAKIVRGLMKSSARLTYTEVQEAFDGNPNDKTAPIVDSIIKPLYAAYHILSKARAARGTVELDLPERKVFLKDGVVQDIISRPRFDSHKLIEEMMILANVATAESLLGKHQPALYRVHAKPDAARWSTTREFLHELGLKTKPGLHPKPQDLQDLLDAVKERDEAPLVNDIVLRSMSQAAYSPENIGHFGLALESYSHFTSPIRRYADLVVHRALIRAFGLGDDGLTDVEQNRLEIIGTHISARERVAQGAERETVDRYIALFLEDKVGATFSARISGVTRFGIFVNVNPFGADGLIPIRTLPQDYYIHDEKRHSLVGRRNGLTFRLAMPLTVRLLEVEAATGRLLMELVEGTFAEPKPQRENRRFDRDRRDNPDRSRGPRRDRDSNPRGRRR